MDLADAVLWTGKANPKPVVEKGSFHDRFAEVRPTILQDEDFEHWFHDETGRPSIPPSVVAGAFLLGLREDCSDREAEQRTRYDLRWKWALGLGLNDHGCDHCSLCVFRGRLLAHQQEGKLFQDIVARAVEAGLLPKRAVQVMDSSPMLGAAAVQDTYKLLRTALHKLVKGHKKELPKELMPQLKRYLQMGKPDIDWQDREARQRPLGRLQEAPERGAPDGADHGGGGERGQRRRWRGSHDAAGAAGQGRSGSSRGGADQQYAAGELREQAQAGDEGQSS